jgi:lysyl-tRNA synthetase class 2
MSKHANVEVTDEEFFTQRMEQIKKAKEEGLNVYPHKYEISKTLKEIKKLADGFETDKKGEEIVSCAGRVVTIRGHGKLFFLTIESEETTIQLILNSGSAEIYKTAEFLRRGDIIGFKGYFGKSRTGESSIFLTELMLLTPCLRVIPSAKSGLKDAETIYRQRHIDLLVNKDSKDRFRDRSRIISYLRNFLISKDCLEVETPMMHVIYGGAAAKPFCTFHNDLKQNLFMRVAPELYLKKLVVGGFNRIFEIGKNFRNEGIDLTHNPEFTACECYIAYYDYSDWMDTTEELLCGLAMEIKGSLQFTYEPKKRDAEEIKVELDFTRPFKRFDILEEVNREFGLELTGENIESSLNVLIKEIEARNITIEQPKTLNRVLDTFIGEFIEPKCINPAFITGHPSAMSPLSKESATRKGITERFEFFINGKEIINSYTELNDPALQRERFLDQVKTKDAGDLETMPIDEDYCKTLEFGLPPTGGWGIGIDRLVMYFTNAANIKDVILFPAMRPENN